MVEEPRRNILPSFAVAILAGAVVWTMQQRSVQEPALPQSKTPSQQVERDRQGPNSAKGDLRTLFSADDYPFQAQTKGEEGVQAELLVDASGKVSGCTILRSSGSAALDTATCSILSRRAHFYPAHDVNGNAVQDIVRTPPIVWRLED